MMISALEHLKKGNLVIFPTDTLYAIGCSVKHSDSIRRLYKIRKTPQTKPSLILATNLEQALSYGEFGKTARQIAHAFWPGPLTIIVKAKKRVSENIVSAESKIAIRVPNQPPLQEIVNKLGSPILAPSANFHGKPSPTMYNEIDKKLIALVDYAIDISNLRNSNQMIGKPSTIIDVSTDNIEIIREGAIPTQEILKSQGGASK